MRSFDTQAIFDQALRSIAVILCGRTTKDVMHLAKSIEKVEPDGTALDSRRRATQLQVASQSREQEMSFEKP